MKVLLLFLMPFGIITSKVPTNDPHKVVYNIVVREDESCLQWTKVIQEPEWHQVGDTVSYYYHEMALIK
jgi:hypothetical protein